MIRAEQAQDFRAVFDLNVAAFAGPAEAELVERLRAECPDYLALVAVDADRVIGHIVFSPVTLAVDDPPRVLGLGPMAVAPDRQREGVGSALIEAGLEHCRALDVDAIVVLGHPGYYPRFGFEPASHFGIDCNFPAPDEAFMALELRPDALRGKAGCAKYHPAFGG